MSVGNQKVDEHPRAQLEVGDLDLTCGHHNCDGRGTYRLPVSCSNCWIRGTGVYTKGHEATCDRCPVCDTRNLRPRRAS